MKNIHVLQENIYITSNEEIKDGDWFLTDDKRVEKCAPDWRAREWHKKIILTTDQDLIIDGVQAIDDEFLEFIVKNPSCEFVKVEEFEPIYGHQNNSNSVLYKIIITSVEPKQETLEEHNYLQGFINQFEEGGEHQEISNDDWTVSQFLKWMKINNFIIVKDENKK